MSRRWSLRRLATAALLAAAVLAGGCTTLSYYAQSAGGQLEVMRKARPIDRVIADPGTPEDLRERLELVREIRRFAVEELALPDSGSYTRYADLDRDFVVWNVFAAEEFSVDPVTWCFPVAGCVPYRGYFRAEQAQAFADELREQGKDVFVGGVAAYSTLGWFRDPVLSTFVHYPPENLAALVFHELAHELYYLPGDAVFNESFAVAVEREGARRWLYARDDPEAYGRYLERQSRDRAITALILEYRDRLGQMYAALYDDGERRSRKAALFAELREAFERQRTQWPDAGGWARFFGPDLSNAHLVAVGAYHQWVPAFEALLADLDGDLEAFYGSVRRLGELEPPARTAELARWDAMARLLQMEIGQD